MKKNEFSESEDESDFKLFSDNLIEMNIMIVRAMTVIYNSWSKSKSTRCEYGSDDNVYTSTEDDWISITEGVYIPQRINFSFGSKVPGPQISSNTFEPIQIFKLFFTDQLVDEIVKETNNYAKNVLSSKKLTKDSSWQTWHDCTKYEFWAFIGVILNMGTMPVSADFQKRRQFSNYF